MTAIVSPISTSNTQYDMNRNDDMTEAYKVGEQDFSTIELESLAQVGLL